MEIVALSRIHENRAVIAREAGVSPKCVATTLNNNEKYGSPMEKPRSGRPRTTTEKEDNIIYRCARANPKMSAAKLAGEFNQTHDRNISSKTIERRLNERKLYSYSAFRQTLLKPTDRANRMKWCRERLSWSSNDWGKVIFSDECNFEVVNRKARIRVRRHPHDKPSERFNKSRLQGGGGSVGFWGCITSQGVGSFYIYDGRLKQYDYIEILQNSMLPTKKKYFRNRKDCLFQQDNAPCHTAGSVKEWLARNKVNLLPWCPRSPDLNPIENLWSWMEKKLTEFRVTSTSNLKELLAKIWQEVTPELCANLIHSMPRRCQKVITNKGYNCGY